MRFLLALLLGSGVTLHSGQVRFYAPGQLQTGAKVVCVGATGSTTGSVPGSPAASTDFVWGGSGPVLSIGVKPGGAAEVACGTTASPERLPGVPYVLGRNGLGRVPGTKTLAGIQKLFGGTARASDGNCRLGSAALGFTAVFAGACAAGSPFVSATVTGRRWSTLDGVRIGDSVARMRWQDAPARRLSAGVWLLGGVGAKGPPRLLAIVSGGRVVRFEIRTR